MTDSFFFFFAVVAATLFAGLSKGGFAGVSMVSIPILALVMPPVQAASVMLPILLIQDAYSVVFYRRTVIRPSERCPESKGFTSPIPTAASRLHHS